VEFRGAQRYWHVVLFDISTGGRVLETDLELTSLVPSAETLAGRDLSEPPRRGYSLLEIRLAGCTPRRHT
jgi:hypothetical protein